MEKNETEASLGAALSVSLKYDEKLVHERSHSKEMRKFLKKTNKNFIIKPAFLKVTVLKKKMHSTTEYFFLTSC